jgi:hypothetical protein
MRKTVLTTLLLTALATTAPLTAQAAQHVPTCLITNGGTHGRLTKTLTCIELTENARQATATGRYAPGDSGQHTETVQLQFKIGRAWLPVTAATKRGKGNLTATTTLIKPRSGTIRACVSVDGKTPICTTST